MTLILTQLDRYGIVHASDSNLTAGGAAVEESRKTFAIECLNAGLTVAGSYSVGGTRLDDWMDDFIQAGASIEELTLGEFAHTLRDQLELEMTSTEKENGSMVHIAGYVQEQGQAHPEFWFVRNIAGMARYTGEYTGTSDTFQISEDFWTRDCPDKGLMESFEPVLSGCLGQPRLGFQATGLYRRKQDACEVVRAGYQHTLHSE